MNYAALSTGTDPANREANDFYPTPPAILPTPGKWSRSEAGPACGDGAISDILASRGMAVMSTDLVDRGYGTGDVDFLAQESPVVDNVITNPPFRHAEAFVHHALALTTGKVALFLRLAFLEGQRRKALFEPTPLARVHVMSRRVPIQRGRLATADDTTGAIAFAWFVWDHTHTGATTLNWLDWKEK